MSESWIANVIVALACWLLGGAILDVAQQFQEQAAERRSQKHLDEMITQIDRELPREFRLRS